MRICVFTMLIPLLPYISIFENEGVQLYNQVKGARYVTRTVDDVFETEEA